MTKKVKIDSVTGEISDTEIEVYEADIDTSTIAVIERGEVEKALSDGYELVGPIVKLSPGQGFRAKFLGDGGIVAVRNPQTQALSEMSTYLFQLEGGHGKIRMLVSAGLRTKLPLTFTGRDILIVSRGQVELSGGRRVNDFLILAK